MMVLQFFQALVALADVNLLKISDGKREQFFGRTENRGQACSRKPSLYAMEPFNQLVTDGKINY